ncbi:hypothetical protein BDQ17DRAFT_1269690 [Cyathus striatus]|nr:hypothetical protein BDQ17DRAFT_1269690 [Cyathus striatus]
MPLTVADGSIDPVSLKQVPEKFIIFYSSVVDGKLWCPDCVVVDGLVQRTFGKPDGPSALVVYVGDRSQWKSSTNIYRGAPWNINSVPTIVRVEDGVEVGRLVDSEIFSGLEEFTR